jgi:hypothetical protein
VLKKVSGIDELWLQTLVTEERCGPCVIHEAAPAVAVQPRNSFNLMCP